MNWFEKTFLAAITALRNVATGGDVSRLCRKITPPTELVLVTGGWTCGDSFRCQCLDYNYLVMLVTTNSLPLDGTSSDLREVGNRRTGFFVMITLAQGGSSLFSVGRGGGAQTHKF